MVRDINQLSVVSCQLPVETNCHHEERSDVVTKYIKDKKMTKKVMLFLLLGLVLCLMLAATGREEALFEQPVLITSAGQSAEVQLASVLAKRAGLASTLKKTATADDLEGQKTLILVVGVSMKGLGAAGLDAAEEKERIQKLISKSQESSIPILCLHLGGEARRIGRVPPLCQTQDPDRKIPQRDARFPRISRRDPQAGRRVRTQRSSHLGQYPEGL